ncbi:hypothetical protein B0I08_10486 [Glaciihabitans tibetensis]|uniref:Uncharacterized protein n=1 Tax=Glaciihabitans tibetensis TaxID=1266600 RepID=A0A2T0VDX1_9MICO|nr:hypothetical protein [Glaciihabitans tibetensis]PRY68384.1 hypothetical protein B0I08_10486 [Glaciihabitans tibetensis]
MKTPLATAPVLHAHPPQPVHTPQPHPVRRVGLLDRAALHLGVALIRWGRRPTRAERRTRATLSPEAQNARRQLEELRNQHESMMMTRFR